jgi:hypothetical protein
MLYLDTITFTIIIIIIISLLMSPLLGHRPPLWITTNRTTTNADWWVLTTANTAGANGLAFRSKEELEVIHFWSPIR